MNPGDEVEIRYQGRYVTVIFVALDPEDAEIGVFKVKGRRRLIRWRLDNIANEDDRTLEVVPNEFREIVDNALEAEVPQMGRPMRRRIYQRMRGALIEAERERRAAQRARVARPRPEPEPEP